MSTEHKDGADMQSHAITLKPTEKSHDGKVNGGQRCTISSILHEFSHSQRDEWWIQSKKPLQVSPCSCGVSVKSGDSDTSHFCVFCQSRGVDWWLDVACRFPILSECPVTYCKSIFCHTQNLRNNGCKPPAYPSIITTHLSES